MVPDQVLQQWQALAAGLPHKALGLAVGLCALALVFGLLERRFGLRPQRFWRPGLAQDVGYYFAGGLLPAFGLVAATAALAWTLGGLLPAGLQAWLASLPPWQRFVAIVVLGDFAFYAAHRWSHRHPWLWRLHAVHHSPKALDWLVNTRAHPLDLVFARAVSAVPLLVLGPRERAGEFEAMAAGYLTLTSGWAFFVHANLRWRLRWLQPLVVTPAFHHWHHADGAVPAGGCNFASLFPWIDRLFGTWHLPGGRFPASYGIDTPLPSTLGGQLLAPFRGRPDRPSAAAAPSSCQR